MRESLGRTDHRPWPVPGASWLWRQRWTDLLFIHWPVPPDVIRPLLPPELQVDVFDEAGWIGLVPFRLSDLSLRGCPAVPWLSHFTEMNLRTYVTDGRKAGVWFLRMDASRVLAVLGARLSLGLPYVWSDMRVARDAERVRYAATRGNAVFRADYGPVGDVREARAGTLEHFLTERYCLYSRWRRDLLRVEIHHPPWPLQSATASIEANTIPASFGLPSPPAAPLLHFAARLDVIGWSATVVTHRR